MGIPRLLLTGLLLLLSGCSLLAPAAHDLPYDDGDLIEAGIASWYGEEYAGRPTASGELFKPEALTAAHPTLPFGTRVRVVHAATQQTVIVRINDRGPFVPGRIIDLSLGAARELGIVEAGLAHVEVRYVKQ